MSAISLPRFLLPRETSLALSLASNFRSAQSLPPLYTLSQFRHASKPASQKPITLEKPAKFYPPSHPSRLNRPPPRQYPGPALSAPERDMQKTKKYPNMMPPEGTFMHWFLTNRAIHVWIILSTLASLATFTFTKSFTSTSPVAHLLPENDTFFSQPLSFIQQWVEVYKLHVAHTSAETAERRMRKVDDVRKRGEYRKAHGLEGGEGLGGWKFAGEGQDVREKVLNAEMPEHVAPVSGEAMNNGSGGREVYNDREGRRNPVKKWFGIW